MHRARTKEPPRLSRASTKATCVQSSAKEPPHQDSYTTPFISQGSILIIHNKYSYEAQQEPPTTTPTKTRTRPPTCKEASPSTTKCIATKRTKSPPPRLTGWIHSKVSRTPTRATFNIPQQGAPHQDSLAHETLIRQGRSYHPQIKKATERTKNPPPRHRAHPM